MPPLRSRGLNLLKIPDTMYPALTGRRTLLLATESGASGSEDASSSSGSTSGAAAEKEKEGVAVVVVAPSRDYA